MSRYAPIRFSPAFVLRCAGFAIRTSSAVRITKLGIPAASALVPSPVLHVDCSPHRNNSRPLLSFLQAMFAQRGSWSSFSAGRDLVSMWFGVCQPSSACHGAAATADRMVIFLAPTFLICRSSAASCQPCARHWRNTSSPTQHCTRACRGCVFRLFTCPKNMIITSTCSFTCTSQLVATAVGVRRPNETQRGVGLPAAGLLCCNSQRRSSSAQWFSMLGYEPETVTARRAPFGCFLGC